MDIFSKFEDECQHFSRPERIRVSAKIEDYETGEHIPGGLNTQKYYFLYAKIGVNYWANDAQRPHAREAAKRELIHAIYEDAIKYVYAIESGIFQDDPEYILHACHELKKALGV